MYSKLEFPITRPALYSGISILVVALWTIRKLVSQRKRLPLPPGPKGLPIVGNVLDLPPPNTPEWTHWLKLKDLYGPLSSITVFGQTIILVHDKDVASEMLEKRAVKFSSRPYMTFATEMCGFWRSFAFSNYNDSLRKERKLAAGQMGSKTSLAKYHSSIDFQARRFLLHLMKDPEQLEEVLKHETSSIVLDMLYGYNTDPNTRTGDTDPLVVMINQMMSDFNKATVTGAWLVDLVPWLRYLPDWVPGTGFKETAREYQKNLTTVLDTAYNFTVQQKARGSERPSYVSNLLNGNPDTREKESIKNSAMALYGGGADTTVASLSWFFLAMSLFPEVQAKAQDEIDRVVGTDRLPGFQDRANLPYVEAVLKETLRWNPIGPLGLPHTADEEDEYRGYRIPKGSIILPSITWFSRDPSNYSEPHVFKPERFLGPSEELNPYSYVFGFGRRICPGRNLAEANMFLVIAQSLAAFNIKKAVNLETGKEIDPVAAQRGQTAGIVSRPTDFKVSITPRSDDYRRMVLNFETEIRNSDRECDAQFIQAPPA
ncbi:hypothetical protein TWF694_005039 [Orbilia ellipsospora]|uniref:Cytochrome P450 n=1 Tax=Orbilia ellipsospora TaxID=2528407 RepID=A0AAV9WUF2_9PEZI